LKIGLNFKRQESQANYFWLIVILLVSFIIRCLYASWDPFLHNWDERFHALVSRNLMESPWVPYLRRYPQVPYEANSWCCNSVWLHKQPLFLWQSALSMKLFGVSVFTLRLPSVFLASLLSLLVYRIALLYSRQNVVGLLAASLMALNQYQLELVAGAQGMDHNDVSFTFYIVGSVWAYLEYLNSGKLSFAILAGLLSGCAVLTKWLVGMLVFLPWVLITIWSRSGLKWRVLLFGLVTAVVIFLPWQLYILNRFHSLALYEYRYNARHVWEVLEGHAGKWYFYLKLFPDYFGKLGSLILAIGVILSIFRKEDRLIRNVLLLMLASVFLFFSFVAQTKMPSYVFIVVPIALVFLALGMHLIMKQIANPLLKVLFILIVLLDTWKPWISYQNRKQDTDRARKIHNTQVYKNLKSLLPEGYRTVVNVTSFEDVELMFFNPDINAYHWWIDTNELPRMIQEGVRIAAFRAHGEYVLPEAYQSYPNLYLIQEEIK
jgi:4-amino-4-deoxy-L-arabinose transferase-like glycosyltransferase